MRTPYLGLTPLGVMAAFSASAPSLAYSPQWLECAGEQVITTETGTTKQPITDVYVFDPDAQNLFLYSNSQKRLGLVGAKATSDSVLSWSGTGSGIPASKWVGRLDRGTMSLQMTYEYGPEKRVWTQSCKPTSPRPESWQLPSS